jgi:hypothetical protein
LILAGIHDLLLVLRLRYFKDKWQMLLLETTTHRHHHHHHHHHHHYHLISALLSSLHMLIKIAHNITSLVAGGQSLQNSLITWTTCPGICAKSLLLAERFKYVA